MSMEATIEDNQVNRDAYLHIWHRCHECGQRPLKGSRFHCKTCPVSPLTELCEVCYQAYLDDRVEHPSIESLVRSKGNHEFVCIHQGQTGKELRRWLEIEMDGSLCPPIVDGFVVRPEFVGPVSSCFGAYAFIIQENGKAYCLTALHVMDEIYRDIAEGLSDEQQISALLPASLKHVDLYDVYSQRWICHKVARATEMLYLPYSALGEEEPYSARDIAAFWIDRNSIQADPVLADENPQVGDPVWLCAKMKNGDRVRKCVVVDNSDDSLIFRMEDSEVESRFTSGAPIINQHGEVVGINIGAGYFAGSEFGHANPVSSIRQHLHSAKELRANTETSEQTAS